jgi:magnesium-protoporphyrin IX monomethyl ester (oxidative) cyclase
MGMKVPPLGLAYIAAVLEKHGYKVKIIDSPTLEIDEDKWVREVKAFSPDIVGMSLLTPLAPRGYRAAKLLKRELPDTIIIAGGPHPTFLYREALDNGFDIVVRGEGELTTLELVKTIEEKGLDPEALKRVRGIAFKSRESIVVTPPRPLVRNLDELPWPARHLLPMDKYTLFGKPIRVAHVMASRGCPYGCIYCSTSYFWGRMVRFRSARDVAAEIEYLVDKYKAKYIVFSDDELTINRVFVRELLKEMKERGLDTPFACGARVDHVDKKLMELLFRNNCRTIYFGVESASQETLDRIGKRIRLEQITKVFQWKKEIKEGSIVASFILGFPWETIDDMKKTVEFAVRLDPDYAQFTVLTPYPGTPLFEYAKRHRLIEDWNWEHYTTLRPVMRGFNFTVKQLEEMIKYAYRRFYLRLSFALRELRRGRLGGLAGILARELMRYLRDLVVHPIPWRMK